MKAGFIGTGRIASAVIKGLCTSKLSDLTIHVSPRNETNSRQLAEIFSNVHRMKSNQHVLDTSDIIVVSVPPNKSKEILKTLKFNETHTIISFIPFLIYSDLTEAVSPARTVSRAIPLPSVTNHTCPIPVFNADDTVTGLLGYIGQPYTVKDENQLHVIWALTGLISSFYDLLNELSAWAKTNGVDESVAGHYLVDMYHAIASSAKQEHPIDFEALIKHAATPGGMNEQAGKEIKEKHAHEAYKIAVDNLLKRFMRQ